MTVIVVLKGEMNVGFIVCYMSNVSDNAVTLNTIGLDKYHSEFSRVILTGFLPMSQKVGETQNRQFSRNLCHSTLSWRKLTTQNIFDLR